MQTKDFGIPQKCGAGDHTHSQGVDGHPHPNADGSPAFRYLAMSNDEKDNQFNPWWSTYCDIERTTSCD